MAGARANVNIHGDQDGFTMRTFETCGVGALQLVDRADVCRRLRPRHRGGGLRRRRRGGRARPARLGRPLVGRPASERAGAARTRRRAHLHPPRTSPGVPVDGLTHPRDLEAWHRWQLGRPAAPAGRPGDPRAPLHRAPGRPPRCRDADPRRPRPGAAARRPRVALPQLGASPPGPAALPRPRGSRRRVAGARQGPAAPLGVARVVGDRHRGRAAAGAARPPRSSPPATTSAWVAGPGVGRGARPLRHRPTRPADPATPHPWPRARRCSRGARRTPPSGARAGTTSPSRSPSAPSCCGRPGRRRGHRPPGGLPRLSRPAPRGRAPPA